MSGINRIAPLLLAAGLTAIPLPVPAAMSAARAAAEMQAGMGTWRCTSSEGTHRSTFTPMFGGKGMRISEGAMGGSEDLVTFDAKRGKWIDEHMDATGYGVMEGVSVTRGINFVQVYPAGQGTLMVRFPSRTRQTTVYNGMMNGKAVSMRESCTRM